MTKALIRISLFVVLAGAVAVGVAHAQSAAPLKIEDALGALTFANDAPVDLSPDGEWVAYTIRDDRKRETPSEAKFTLYTKTGVYEEAIGCDIWITNTKTGESRNLTKGKGSSWSPVWSPDGKYLAFYSDRGGVAHLWLWEKTSGQFREIPSAIVRPFFNSQAPQWRADGRAVLFKALPEGMTVAEAADLIVPPGAASAASTKGETKSAITAKVYTFVPQPKDQNSGNKAQATSSDPNAWMDRYLSDLVLLDVSTGKLARPVTRRRPMAYSFSPDGKYFSYSHFKTVPENTQQIIYELAIVPVDGGPARVVVSDMPQMDGYVSWSPDGRQLAYVTSGPKTRSDCYLVPVDGGAPVNLTPGEHPPFSPSFGEEQRLPVWSRDGKDLFLFSPATYGREGMNKVWKIDVARKELSELATIPNRVVMHIVGPLNTNTVWSPDSGRSMLVMTQHQSTKDIGLYSIDLQTGAIAKLFERAMHVNDEIFRTDVAGNGLISFVAQDVTHPEDIWLWPPAAASPTKLTAINPQFEHVEMGRSRTISWLDLDGRQLHGALLLPSGYQEGKRYPLIVNVYGGEHLSNVVNRFGFFGAGSDNMQILATRGYAVLLPDSPLNPGTPMLDLLKTVTPGVIKAIELGIADPQRIGVMGHSYGGYSTLALITQTRIFKAAMASAGISDLISHYGALNEAGFSSSVGWAEAGQGGMPGHPWNSRATYIENSPVFYLDRVQTPLLLIHSSGDEGVPVAQSEEVFVGLRRLGKEVTFVKYAGETHWEGLWGAPNIIDYWTRVISWFDRHLKK